MKKGDVRTSGVFIFQRKKYIFKAVYKKNIIIFMYLFYIFNFKLFIIYKLKNYFIYI